MASAPTAPDYSIARMSRISRLSVRLPQDTLHSSLVESSPYFSIDPETARMAHDADRWLSSSEDVARPRSTAPSSMGGRHHVDNTDGSVQPQRRMRPPSFPSFGSFRYSLRYDETRPRTAPQTTESTEKLTQVDLNDRDGDTASAEAQVQHADADEDDFDYPTGIKLVLITLALCMAVFVMALGEYPLSLLHNPL